jgi:hypothetical protein
VPGELFFIIIEFEFLAFSVLINPAYDMEFHAFQLRPLLDILGLITRSFFTEDITDALRARVNMCLVNIVYILLKAFDCFVLVFFAIFNAGGEVYR